MNDSRSMRWWGVITLFVIVAISYVDRINISVLITDRDFLSHIGLTADDRTRQGLLATAFMVGYGVSSLVLTPFCAALFGVRRSLIGGLLLWGVVTFLSPAMSSYGLLLASRILLGVSEGPLFSLAGSYIKAHFESRENGKPNSLVNMGTGVGLAVGYPLVGYLVAGHDWETSFHVLGLINVLLGDMSIVGPRPEVSRYVALYPADVRAEVLSVRPGITDLASVQYRSESTLLAQSSNPEQTYVDTILPAKLALCRQYVRERSFWLDLRIIGMTLGILLKP